MVILTTLLLSTLITVALIPMSRKLAIRMNIVDLPDARKIHSKPIPRSGGVAMVLGAFLPVVFQAQMNQFLIALVISTVIIVGFGVVDDMKGLNFKQKLAAQTLSALIIILYGGVRITHLGGLLPEDTVLPFYVSIPLTLLVMVGVINAINLSDGLDGLAGGICLLIFVCIGYLGYRADAMPIAVTAFAMVGAIVGFLRFNTYPARLFMGDAGSQFLGLIAVSLSIHLTQGNTPLSRLLPLILLGFPILDTLAVMTERIANGQSPFVADKNHFHHKLMSLGLYHSESVTAIYLLQGVIVLSAFIFRFHPEWMLLVGYLIFSGLIVTGFYWAENTHWQFKRISFIDASIKGRLSVLREKSLLIIYSFKLLKTALPALLFATCLLATDIPGYFSFFILGVVFIFLFTLIFSKKWLHPALRIGLYLVIPFVVYFSSGNSLEWKDIPLAQIYNVSFAAIALLAILTIKFTRRKSGFRITPMDVLILFFALIVPNIPGTVMSGTQMGLIAAKIIVFFFSYDVLLGELRGNHKWLAVATICAFSIVSLKGFLAL